MRGMVMVCQTLEEVFEAAAHLVWGKTAACSASGSSFSIALSGGSTPRGLFRLLAAEPYRSRCHWPSFRVFWGDERCVPPDHPESNYRMAKESLLDRVPILPQQVFRIEGERKAEEAALHYERILREQLACGDRAWPRFDLILLGMGADGHTASLFPGTAALRETERAVVANWVEKLHSHRITLTPEVLNSAKDVVFLVSGQDKAAAVHAVLEGPAQPQIYPSQLVKPSFGQLTWILDQSAASLLTSTLLTSWGK
ncbi:MAG: 6-phosphogluconolactonase [Nitrospira sp.]|nr:6-phosphogluconolactonase [Nitrospira sp.]